MGSKLPCGGAELSPVIDAAECQLLAFRFGCLATAEEVRKPPKLTPLNRREAAAAKNWTSVSHRALVSLRRMRGHRSPPGPPGSAW